MGETLTEDVIGNAEAQLERFGLKNTELVVRQASGTDRLDLSTLQKNYVELLGEKNRRIAELQSQIERYRVVDAGVDGISQELGVMMPSVGSIALTKGVRFDCEGAPCDTLLLGLVTPRTPGARIDTETLKEWLRLRTKIRDIRLFIEEPSADEN